MSESQPPGGSPPPQLQYRSGIDERISRPRVPIGVQAILGTLISSFAIALAMALALSSGSTGFAIVLFFVTGFAFAGLAIFLKSDPKTRGWAIGIWIGIALTGLLEGICFIGFGT
jgi:hypothetical protein